MKWAARSNACRIEIPDWPHRCRLTLLLVPVTHWDTGTGHSSAFALSRPFVLILFAIFISEINTHSEIFIVDFALVIRGGNPMWACTFGQLCTLKVQ